MDAAPRAYDLRAEQPDPPALAKQKHKIVNHKVVSRPWSTITGVVLHQTDCVFGVTPQALTAAHGDVELATARRSLNVACHGLAFRNGFYALPNPLAWYVWHANGLNATTLGLEIEGVYPGLDSGHAGAGDTPVTPLLIATARACLARLVTEARAAGAPLVNVYAHRQSSDTRRGDPGEALWKAVALEYAVPVLGLKCHPAEVCGDGAPIPVEWDTVGGIGRY